MPDGKKIKDSDGKETVNPMEKKAERERRRETVRTERKQKIQEGVVSDGSETM